jgi:hypothetical protein
MPTEEELLLELEIAGLRHQTALFYFQQTEAIFQKSFLSSRQLARWPCATCSTPAKSTTWLCCSLMAYLRHAKIRLRLAC